MIEVDIFSGCRALIDTGAEIPVWTADESLLAALDGVQNTGLRRGISGFGGVSVGNVYWMTWNLGDLHYVDMPLIACRMKRELYHIILPATLFDGMRYTIDNVRKKAIFEVEDNQIVRHVKVRGVDGNLYILSQGTKQRGK